MCHWSCCESQQRRSRRSMHCNQEGSDNTTTTAHHESCTTQTQRTECLTCLCIFDSTYRNRIGRLARDRTMSWCSKCKISRKLGTSRCFLVGVFAHVGCPVSCAYSSTASCLVGFVKILNRSTSHLDILISVHDVANQYIPSQTPHAAQCHAVAHFAAVLFLTRSSLSVSSALPVQSDSQCPHNKTVMYPTGFLPARFLKIKCRRGSPISLYKSDTREPREETRPSRLANENAR